MAPACEKLQLPQCERLEKWSAQPRLLHLIVLSQTKDAAQQAEMHTPRLWSFALQKLSLCGGTQQPWGNMVREPSGACWCGWQAKHSSAGYAGDCASPKGLCTASVVGLKRINVEAGTGPCAWFILSCPLETPVGVKCEAMIVMKRAIIASHLTLTWVSGMRTQGATSRRPILGTPTLL